jgi:hypothetical protein
MGALWCAELSMNKSTERESNPRHRITKRAAVGPHFAAAPMPRRNRRSSQAGVVPPVLALAAASTWPGTAFPMASFGEILFTSSVSRSRC